MSFDISSKRLIDVSRTLHDTPETPGEIVPRLRRVSRMDEGSLYNLSEISMCVHNGTHVDAPLHFVADGREVVECPLDVFVGECYVKAFEGDITAGQIDALPQCCRLLIKGDATVTEEAAEAIVRRGITMVGIERNAIGVPGNTQPVHVILLSANTGVLEGLDLSEAPEGEAFIMAQPLKIADSEGAPCRALLFVD